jgi:hypothetical protein
MGRAEGRAEHPGLELLLEAGERRLKFREGKGALTLQMPVRPARYC